MLLKGNCSDYFVLNSLISTKFCQPHTLRCPAQIGIELNNPPGPYDHH
jgi:hypothetical protein